jgi:PleD family two-component response regulator
MHPDLDNLKRSDAPARMQNGHLHNEAPVRVLVVDDSRTSADALSAYLQAGDMSVRTVYHGPDAL